MTRILLLMLFLLWMAGTTDMSPRPPDAIFLNTVLFLSAYAVLVGGLRVWSVHVGRNVASANFGRNLDRFNRVLFVARCFIPAWFGVAIFFLGWGWLIDERLGLGHLQSTRLPSVLLGTLPSIVAWIGLWWSQYPAERALREQNLLSQLGDDDLPLHAPPGFRAYFFSNLRLQLLFTIVPVLLMILVRDAISVSVANHLPGRFQTADQEDGLADTLVWIASASVVLLVAPEVLRRVLRTHALPDGPLRRRLESLCRRSGVRYRQILYWDTDQNMGNAAVMGIVPWVRYILLSDVLIETMTDDQIEAVFAHEVGHVVHRHMAWFVVFFAGLFSSMWGVERVIETSHWVSANAIIIGSLVISPAAFCLGFGFLSRRFERQADVYAARTIQQVGSTREAIAAQADRLVAGARFVCPAGAIATTTVGLLEGQGFIMGARRGPATSVETAPAAEVLPSEFSEPSVGAVECRGGSYVGAHGATVFASALHRVARVNNIPVSRNEWLHGSIASRMEYLRDLSADPMLTGRFDRRMIRIYCGLLFALIASAVWLGYLNVR